MKRETKSAWADVIESMKADTLRDDDMTVERFALATNRSIPVASKRLNEMQAQGKVEKRWVVHRGKRVIAYRLSAKG